MAHDFERFPELTNSQLQLYYFDSPHKQILEGSFQAIVENVHDGDTITVRWEERDFPFPVRFSNIAAPELNEEGGHEAQSWLENKLLGEEITITVNPQNRVEKWGRLLGTVLHMGMDAGEEQIHLGLSKNWEDRNAGVVKSPIKGFVPK